jgi:hypothetical protein
METTNVTRPALPGIGELFSFSWHFYRRNIRRIVQVMAATAGAVIVLFGIVLVPLGVSPFAIDDSFFAPSLSEGLSALFIVVVLGAIFIFLWGESSLIVLLEKEDLSFRELLAHALKFIAGFVWVSFITGVIVVLGFILLIIPGLIFFVWFNLSYLIYFFEHRRGFEAVKQSRAYVRGYFWPVAGRFLVLFLVVSVPINILDAAGTFGHVDALVWLSNIASILAFPIILGYQYRLYLALREIKGSGAAML